jgi:PKD repeat protein
MFKNLLASLILLLAGFTVNAQELKVCGTTEMWKEAIQKDPVAAERNAQLREFQQNFASYAERTAGGTFIYTIPVVFHVMHEYGNENISKAQIEDAMRILNLSFRKLNPDTVDVIPLFQPIFADCEIQFRLANLDPQGNCTDGITRTYTRLTNNAGDNVKSLIQWNSSRYLNIWVVKHIASGAAGYAYYPGISGSIDGIVILHDYVGGIGTSNGSNYTERSLTHEVGHWLDLPHVWGSSNTPGLASNCNIDDGIWDTPNTRGTNLTGCNTAQNTCGQVDNVQNYMDYSTCHKMFTEGQRDRMHNALNSSVGSRNNLWDPSNLLLTGTEDNHVTTACTPKADFSNQKFQICAGSSLIFKDASWRDEITGRTWIFNGGSPATDTASSVTVTYATPGTYDVTLIVTSAGGTDTLTRTASVTVIPAVSLTQIPYSEGFESLIIPGSEWAIENPENNNEWTINSLGAATGLNSIRLVNQVGNVQGSTDGLITPALNFTGMTGVQLTYKLAFAPKVPSDTSAFKIYVSTNCGRTWQLRSNRYGSVIHTAPPNFAGAWVPLSTHWTNQSLSLAAFSNQPNVRIKFEFVNHNGNNIYLDDINVASTIGIEYLAEKYNLNIFPNPAGGVLNVEMNLQQSAPVKLELTDLAGRMIYSRDLGMQPAGAMRSAIHNDNNFSGMYILRIKAGDDLIQSPVVFGAE